MRPVVLIAGVALAAASAAVAQPAAKPTCEKATTLASAVSALFGRSTCRAPAPEGVPGAGQAVAKVPHRDSEPAAAPANGHVAGPRLAATAACREALPLYDAGGQATYLPTRACGRS